MDKKTKFWIVLLGALFALGCFSYILIIKALPGGRAAHIYLDGERIRVVELGTADEPYEFTVECGSGNNTIRVERGGISVVSADCPDKLCVMQGEISKAGVPIVCLPHRLVIEIEEDIP